MTSRDAEETNPVIVKCAILITGASMSEFRAKDVLFNVDLVKSVARTLYQAREFDLQATQVLRLFDKYKKKGWADSFLTGSARVFKVTPEGFHGILKGLVHLDLLLPASEALFTQWFLDAYKEYLKNKISQLTEKMQADVAAWTNTVFFLQCQIGIIDRSIQDMTSRVHESRKLQEFISNSKNKGLSDEEVLKSLPSDFSYKLSHQKRLGQWISELPSEIRANELERGIKERETLLYQTNLDYLVTLKKFYSDEIEKRKTRLSS